MRKIVIHQPQYFPWLGLLDKINQGDIYIILDNVQFLDGGFQNRNTFLSNDGKKHILTIPVFKKNHLNKYIKDMRISNDIWQKKHYKFLYFNYKKFPYFDEIFDKINFLFEKRYKYLIDVAVDSMLLAFDIYGIDASIKYSSQILPETSYQKEDLIIQLLKQIKANIYLSGNGARAYQYEENFNDNGINLEYQNFIHPSYNQFCNKNEFIEGLSCLDMAFNLGLEGCNKILDH